MDRPGKTRPQHFDVEHQHQHQHQGSFNGDPRDGTPEDEGPNSALKCIRENGFLSPVIPLQKSPYMTPNAKHIVPPQIPTVGSSLTWVSFCALALLILQNTAISLTMRASRLPNAERPMYYATSAVLVSEFVKFVASLTFLIFEKQGLSGAFQAVKSDILLSLRSNLLLLIPSALYTLQNNLQYYAATHLDPATFQVLYQMKLITTAMLSVAMLGRELSRTQWISVIVLTGGIAIVQTDKMGGAEVASQTSGFVAVLVACCTSAGAGVFLEKLVKQTAPSVWIRNIQLSVFGMAVGGIACILKDGDGIAENGVLHGFDLIVWVVVFLQSMGGILVAVVLKYADNIVKGFATGLSIIVTGAASVVLFHLSITTQYSVGASLVVVCRVFLLGAILSVPKIVAVFEKGLYFFKSNFLVFMLFNNGIGYVYG